MSVEHLEFLVEEPSMEAFLNALLPRLLPNQVNFRIHVFQGKMDLLQKLPHRLRGYASWLPDTWRIIVIVDRDNDDCHVLKARLESIANAEGLRTRTTGSGTSWQVVNRLAIEELEAWYFGDWDAVRRAYPRVPEGTSRQRNYRDPDAIPGGTWEAFERILQRAGYFKGGLRKIEAARRIGALIDPNRNQSHSFAVFRETLREVIP
ncbi:DUF4276 family protein [Candidatus Parcubacteria bacterium]|nr:MAG: DUF4276 family protein [Candidatus Parcubacteria bacterium]